MKSLIHFPFLTENAENLPLYVTTIGTTLYEEYVCRPEGRSDWQILYSERGRGKAEISGIHYNVDKGSILVLPPDTPHTYFADGDTWLTHWVTFSGRVEIFGFEPGIYKLPESFNFSEKIQDIISYRNKPEWRLKSSSLLYALLLECREYMSDNAINIPKAKHSIDLCINYIGEHLDGVIDLSEMADYIGVSKEYICRLFKLYVGMRPFEYINNLRIQYAKEYLIVYPRKSIKAISVACGFQSESYFSRIFKSKTGVTPGEYRKRCII